MDKINRKIIFVWFTFCITVSFIFFSGCSDNMLKNENNSADIQHNDITASSDTSADGQNNSAASRPDGSVASNNDFVGNENSNKPESVVTPPQNVQLNYNQYKISQITVSVISESTYGITWQTDTIPNEPVVRVSLGGSYNKSDFVEYPATFKLTTSKAYDKTTAYYYVCKAKIDKIESGKTYTYICCDKGEKIADKEYTFCGKNSSDSFKFVHISDSQVQYHADSTKFGTTGNFLKSALDSMKAGGFSPDFMLHTGDMVHENYIEYWADMLNINKKYFTSVPVAAISGNHEANYNSTGVETLKRFNYETENDKIKGVYYTFAFGNTRFIMLNTNDVTGNKLSEAQYKWLEDILKNKTEKWTIVGMHNPMYSIGKYVSNPSYNAIGMALREQLSDLFAKYGVDLVLQAHDHAYSVTRPIGENKVIDASCIKTNGDTITYNNPNGVIYAMHGPAGNQIRGKDSEFTEERFYEAYGTGLKSSWAEVDVNDNSVKVVVKGLSNEGKAVIWKTYSIYK